MAPIAPISLNTVLVTALVAYPSFFSLIVHKNPSSERFTLTREVLSVLHATLISLASAAELYRLRDKWVPPAYYGHIFSTLELEDRTQTGAAIIDTRSTTGNAVVAWECGYLLADFIILVVGARWFYHNRQSRLLMARSISWRILGWHHLGIGCSLALYHAEAQKGKEKGVLVILIMFLMNIS